MTQLTSGVLKDILNACDLTTLPVNPVLQVLALKKLTANNGTDRYRIVLSDGQFFITSAILATQLNDLVVNGTLDTFAVVCLDKYTVHSTNKKVIMIVELKVLEAGSVVGAKRGSPQAWKETESDSSKPQGTDIPQHSDSEFPNKIQRLNENSSISSSLSANNNNSYPDTDAGAFKRKSSNNSSRLNDSSNSCKGSVIFPISSLTPYQNRWTIRARVTSKSAIRAYKNARGDGKLFSFDFADESGEIKVTAFNDSVVKFFDMIQPGKCYLMSRGTIKAANKQFSTLNHQYEISFNNDTILESCTDEVELPPVKYNFVAINEISACEKDAAIDVVAVIKSIGVLSQFVSKNTGVTMSKRNLVLVDRSEMCISVTLWGGTAESDMYMEDKIIVLRGVRVSDFNFRSLSALNSTNIEMEPDIPEVVALRRWYLEEGGRAIVPQPLSSDRANRTSFSDFSSENGIKPLSSVHSSLLGSRDKADYVTVRASLLFARPDNALYKACPGEKCMKKVTEESPGIYRCEKCNQNYKTFQYRLIIKGNIVDCSSSIWVTFFQDSAESLVGKTAQELGMLQETGNPEFEKAFADSNFSTFILKLRVKNEVFNEESKLNVSVISILPLDYIQESKRLLHEIDRLELLE